MARPFRPERVDELVAAALRVFAARGYRRAQMADVARELGVSTGSLYRYVAGKDALFHLVVERGLRETPPPRLPRLPVPTPRPGETQRRLRERMEEAFSFASLERALARQRGTEARSELEAIVRELHGRTAALRLAADVVERSAPDLPELAALWYDEFRPAFLRRLAGYLERRIAQGALRAVPDPAMAARMIVESVTWFARHRHWDPGGEVDAKLAEETVVHFVLSTLAPREEQ